LAEILALSVLNSRKVYQMISSRVLVFALCKIVITIGLGGFAVSTMAAESDEFDAAQVYQARCYACHGTGAAQAPLLGDVIAWEVRLEKGLDTVVQNAITGLNGSMPPRGLCAECSDDDLKAIVDYMIEMSK
jgi:cytochrome c5